MKKIVLLVSVFLACAEYGKGQIVSIDTLFTTGHCVPAMVTFERLGTNPNITQIRWDFGQGAGWQVGSSIAQQYYTQAGTYNVKLEVEYNGTIVIIDSIKITIYDIPHFSFSADKDTVCPGEVVNFTTNLIPPTTVADIVSYNWSFGDGSSDSGMNVSLAYLNAANIDLIAYSPSLLLTNKNGCQNRVTINDMIHVRRRPVVDFTTDKGNNAVFCLDFSAQTELVQFINQTDSNTKPPLTGNNAYVWDFGDGTTSAAQNPIHAYGAGNHNVTLTATNLYGCTASRTRPSIVVAVDYKVSTIPSSTVVLCGVPTQFTIVGGDPNPAISYYFDFGNGRDCYNTGSNLCFTYFNTEGIYQVKIRGTHLAGCKSYDTVTVIACRTCSNDSATICLGDSYTDDNFTNLTKAGVYYRDFNNWDSVVYLNLFVDTIITHYSATICQGSTYSDSNFTNLTQAGKHYLTIPLNTGCDSLICLSLSITAAPINNYSAIICEDSIYSDNHFTNLTQAGTYYDTLQTAGGCDSIVALTLSVINCQIDISGKIKRADQTFLSSGEVELFLVQNGQYILNDTVSVASDGSYLFTNVLSGKYVIKAIPDSSENALPTYYGNTEHWYEADTISIDMASKENMDITIISLSPLGGSAFISGYVGKNDGSQGISQKSVEHPAVGVDVYLQKYQSGWITIAHTRTNENGYFEFCNISAGKHQVILDIPGAKHVDNPQVIDINEGDTIRNIEYEITENGIVNKSGGDVGIVGTRHALPLQVYPNPVNYELKIMNYEGGVVEIFDVVGRILTNFQFSTLNSQLNIDVSHLAAGMYFLKVDNKVVRFVKE